MPFKSKAQQRFMYANHPDIAKRWEDRYGIAKNLPQHVKKAKKKGKGSLSKTLRNRGGA